jgi:hypothetical protein
VLFNEFNQQVSFGFYEIVVESPFDYPKCKGDIKIKQLKQIAQLEDSVAFNKSYLSYLKSLQKGNISTNVECVIATQDARQ